MTQKTIIIDERLVEDKNTSIPFSIILEMLAQVTCTLTAHPSPYYVLPRKNSFHTNFFPNFWLS